MRRTSSSPCCAILNALFQTESAACAWRAALAAVGEESLFCRSNLTTASSDACAAPLASWAMFFILSTTALLLKDAGHGVTETFVMLGHGRAVGTGAAAAVTAAAVTPGALGWAAGTGGGFGGAFAAVAEGAALTLVVAAGPAAGGFEAVVVFAAVVAFAVVVAFAAVFAGAVGNAAALAVVVFAAVVAACFAVVAAGAALLTVIDCC